MNVTELRPGNYFMDGGNIVEENTPQEFFTNPQSPRLQEFLSKVL